MKENTIIYRGKEYTPDQWNQYLDEKRIDLDEYWETVKEYFDKLNEEKNIKDFNSLKNYFGGWDANTYEQRKTRDIKVTIYNAMANTEYNYWQECLNDDIMRTDQVHGTCELIGKLSNEERINVVNKLTKIKMKEVTPEKVGMWLTLVEVATKLAAKIKKLFTKKTKTQ